MAAKLCNGCGKPIKDGQASIISNTLTTREAWHHACCPWLPRGEVIGEPDARKPQESHP